LVQNGGLEAVRLRLAAFFLDMEIRIGKKNYQCPASWAEVDKRKAIGLVRLVYNCRTAADKREIFVHLTSVPRKTADKINAAQWFDIFENCLRWLFQPTAEQPFPAWKEFYLPASSMEFSSIIEYAMALNCLELFADTNDEKHLFEFFFTLCRRRTKADTSDAGWNGDIRERYNTALVRKHAAAHQPPPEIVTALVQFFIGCRNEVVDTYEVVYPKKQSDESEPIRESDSLADFLKIIKKVAQTGLYGDYEATCHTNLHTFMLNYEQDLIEQHELRRNQKRTEADF
jgi:hypothetical protein